jgi:N-methylhydantoinase B
MAWASAAGYGDPLERDPKLVKKDILDQYITESHALEEYGVAFDKKGSIDQEKTEALRAEARAERIADQAAEERDHIDRTGDEIPVSEGLEICNKQGQAFYVCTKCRSVIEKADRNYKSGCIRRETDLKEVGISPIDPELFIDDTLVFREYFCPECGLRFQADFCKKDDPDIWDIQLFLD